MLSKYGDNYTQGPANRLDRCSRVESLEIDGNANFLSLSLSPHWSIAGSIKDIVEVSLRRLEVAEIP
jgi:hypothetical protein